MDEQEQLLPRRLDAHRRAAGRPELTFHDLRHTPATLLLAHSGAELAELAELKFVLGHGQIAHTVDLYGHLVPGRLEGLRATFDPAVTAANTSPAATPAAPGEQSGRAPLRLVT